MSVGAIAAGGRLGTSKSLLIATSRAMRELLRSPDTIAALPSALRLIGEAAEMDRLLVLLEAENEEGRLVHRVFREWVAPGVATHESVGLCELANEDFPELVGRLREGGDYWITITQLNERGRRHFERLGIQTTTGFPIFAGGKYIGLLAFDDCRAIREQDEEIAEALKAAAQVIEAAMERELVIERAARERALELKKSTFALQATIEALRVTKNADEIVPRVLEIVARAFGTTSCALYENSPTGIVLLRYWNIDGKTLLPEELALLDQEGKGLVRSLARGFEVPDGYLGGPASEVLQPVVLDHVEGTAVAAFDAFAVANGWELELNVPVAAGNMRVFTLCIYREKTNRFSEREIELADALAKQLGLAMEASRLSEGAKASGISQERERQVREQVEVLQRANEALRLGVDRAAQGDRVGGLLEGLLLGSMCVTGAAGGAITLWRDGLYAGTQCVAQDGKIVPVEEWAAEPFFQEVPEVLAQDPDGFTSRLQGKPYTRETLEWAREVWPACAEYHGTRGHREVWNVPCVSRGSLLASLGLAFRESRDSGPVLIGTLTALAQQVALGLEMARHAEELKEASLAREKLDIARSRADELAKAHAVLRLSSERLTSLEDLDEFLQQIVQSAVEAGGGAGGGIGLLDAEGRMLRVVAVVDDSGPNGELVKAFGHPVAVVLEGPYREAWDKIAASDGYWWATPEDVGFTGEFREYHDTREHGQIAHIRMAIQDEAIGFLAIAFREGEEPTAPRLEMLRVLAQQASLAIALSRLAEQARETAILRDREDQAKRTGEFLANTVTSLSSGADLAVALGSVVEQLAMAIDAAHLFLFRHDPESRTIQLQLSWIDGQLRWGVSGDELPLWSASFPDDITPAWRIMCDQRGLFTPDRISIPAAEFGWPGFGEYAARFEFSDIAHMVLFAGETAVGSLGFGFRGGKKLNPADKLFIELAAQQAAVVIRMLDLSDEARDAAVARERAAAAVERGRELAAANDGLRLRDRLLTAVTETMRGLLGADDFDAAMKVALQGLGEAAGMDRVKVILPSVEGEGSEPAHELVYEWWAPWLSSQVGVGVVHFPDESIAEYLIPLKLGKTFWQFIDEVPEVLRESFERVGMKSMGIVPIFAGARYAGLVAFDDCRTHRNWSKAEIDALTIAAGAIGAALQQREMEKQRLEAILEEREAAAEKRAMELAKTNEALRKTLDALAFEPSLDAVLGQVLSAIARHLECSCCAMWLLEKDTGRFRPRLLWHDGAVLKDGPEFDECVRTIWHGGRDLMFREHIRLQKPMVHQVADITDRHPRVRAFLEALGVHTLLGVPLLLGGEIIGSLAVRFHSPRELSPEELALSQAMSHQATLAIQLTRMAAQAGTAAVSEERARFARDLHDTLAQGFTGILMQLGAASQVPGVLRSEIAPELEAVTALARTSLAEARRSVRALRPARADDSRLDQKVEQLVERLRLQTKADIVLKIQGTRSEIAPQVENELSRIVQESLNNVAKHAAPNRIAVAIEFQAPNAVRLSVKDDGIGFDPTTTPGIDSFGLLGMQERAASIGASLTVVSEKSRGTEIIVQYGKGTAA